LFVTKGRRAAESFALRLGTLEAGVALYFIVRMRPFTLNYCA
jgi:hypothetical protein